MKKLALLSLLVFFVTACGGEKFDQQAAFDEVMDVHDAAMPKIGEIMSLKKQILEKAGAESDASVTEELRGIASDLESAQEGMMIWMRSWAGAFEPHKKGETTIEEQKAFFKAEMEKVTKVKDDIFESIDKAKAKLK